MSVFFVIIVQRPQMNFTFESAVPDMAMLYLAVFA